MNTQRIRRWSAALLCSFAAPAFCEISPLPPPLSGEQITHELILRDKQFAPAVAGPDGSALIFTQEGGNPTRWQVWPPDESRQSIKALTQFKVPMALYIGYSVPSAAKYASVGVAQGTWLIGPTIQFIRPDGNGPSGKLKWPRNNVKAVGLPDGSAVVVGGYGWPETRDFPFTLKAERVSLDSLGNIKVEELPPVPVDISGTGVWDHLWGFTMVHAGKGSVMLAGGEYRNLAFLLEPGAKSWRKLASMKHPRTDPALVLLPDGRIWATGGKGIRSGTETTSEIWSPASQTWSTGPDLPVPMLEHCALLNPNRDTALLAGGFFPTVLAWKMGSEKVYIVAQHAHQRRNAGVVALANNRLALFGGRYARHYGEGWGLNTPGASTVILDRGPTGTHSPAWPTTRVGALLEHQGQILAIGGLMHHNHNGSDADVGTRLVERQDSSGRVTTLAPLPVEVGRTQAAWISESEALVHAEGSSGEPGTKQWLGLVNINAGAQRSLPIPENGTYFMSDGVHRRMRLVGAHAGSAWLVAEDADALRVRVDKGMFEPAPRLQRKRQGFIGRVLSDGRVVIAGGSVESELVAARKADCTDCPVRYVGYGGLLPSRRHEMFDPSTGAWSTSAPSYASGGPATVMADGRVAKLGLVTELSKPNANGETEEGRPTGMLEVSDAAGKSWRTIALPPDMKVVDSAGGVQVLSVQNEAEGLQRALFVGFWFYKNAVTLWWVMDDIDAPAPVWREFGMAIPPYTFPLGPQDSGRVTADGRKLFVVGSDTGVVAYGKKR